jgi:hypothetical protein
MTSCATLDVLAMSSTYSYWTSSLTLFKMIRLQLPSTASVPLTRSELLCESKMSRRTQSDFSVGFIKKESLSDRVAGHEPEYIIIINAANIKVSYTVG